VLAANEGKLQLVMRNYGDQEDAATSGSNKESLLNGDPPIRDPGPTTTKSVESKPAPAKPKVRRVAPVAAHTEKPAEPQRQPIARKSVELIEGSKRRDVDVP